MLVQRVSSLWLMLIPFASIGCEFRSTTSSKSSNTPSVQEPLLDVIDFSQTSSTKSIDWGVPPVKQLHAKNSFFNRPAPKLIVEKWIGDQPDVRGKFVLIDFWATWCGPCIRAIPELNYLAKQFPNDLVVIGISSESEATVRDMTDPVIQYYSAVDTKGRTKKSVGVSGIPHVLLIDPSGKVCWQGFPFENGFELSKEVIRDCINRYEGNVVVKQ
jgi:cytochrome c biogenesis protein CcmG, thiol:disulfide interchange protein DsbE